MPRPGASKCSASGWCFTTSGTTTGARTPNSGSPRSRTCLAIVAATTIPVQAVGGLTIDQAVSCPSLGAGVVVFGAPLAISDEKSFNIADGDLLSILTDAIAQVHAREVVYP